MTLRVAVNDLDAPARPGRLLKNNFVQGTFRPEVKVTRDGMIVGDRAVAVSAEPEPFRLPIPTVNDFPLSAGDKPGFFQPFIAVGTAGGGHLPFVPRFRPVGTYLFFSWYEVGKITISLCLVSQFDKQV